VIRDEEHAFAPSRSPAADSRIDVVALKLPDGYETPLHVHAPAADRNRLPVVYLHGIQSHPGWFYASAQALAAGGHLVVQVTRRGSGQNTLDRGHAESLDELLEDTRAACRFTLDRANQDKLHLLAVSWGGKLAAAFAGRPDSGRAVASLTMVCPGIAPRVDVSGWTKLCVAAALLVSPRRTFDIPLNEVNLFTDNEEMRRYLSRDELRLHRATAKLFYVSRVLDRMLGKLPSGSLKMPVSLILAARDRIIDNERTRRIVQRLADGKADVRVFPGAHVLEFEPDPQPFFDALSEAISRGET